MQNTPALKQLVQTMTVLCWLWMQERLFLLTDKRCYRIKYDFESKQVVASKAISLVRCPSTPQHFLFSFPPHCPPPLFAEPIKVSLQHFALTAFSVATQSEILRVEYGSFRAAPNSLTTWVGPPLLPEPGQTAAHPHSHPRPLPSPRQGFAP